MNLLQFLVQAKRATYASGEESKEIRERDNSKSLFYRQGDWLYHDNYFGSRYFGGREVVFWQQKPVWMMVYYGGVVSDEVSPREVYKFLQQALQKVSEDTPFRGPRKFQDGSWYYINDSEWDINSFRWVEKVWFEEKLIYQGQYGGGKLK